jgi:hypothetical protein
MTMAWLAEHFAGKEVEYTVITLKGGTKVFPSYVKWIWETHCRKCGQEVLLYRQGCLACALRKTGECTEEIPGRIINNYRCDRWAYEDEDCEESNKWWRDMQARYPEHFSKKGE